MPTSISVFCMFIRVYDITYLEIQFNHLKVYKSVKNGQKNHKAL